MNLMLEVTTWVTAAILYLVVCYRWSFRLVRALGIVAGILVALPFLPGVWITSVVLGGPDDPDEPDEHEFYDGGMR